MKNVKIAGLLLFTVLTSFVGQAQRSSTSTTQTAGARPEIWVYSSDPTRVLRTQAHPSLTDYIIVVEKSRATTNSPQYRYRISILGDNTRELQSVLLTMVISEDVNVDPNSFRTLTHKNVPGRGILQNILSRNDRGWQDLSVQQPMIEWGDKTSKLAQDVIGFVPKIGTGTSLVEGYADVVALFKDAQNIYPSTSLSAKLQDVNRFDAHTFGAAKLRPPFITSGSLVFGVRCEMVVDETNGEPEFFILAKNSRNETIGIEVNSDRRNPIVSGSGSTVSGASPIQGSTSMPIKIGLVDNSKSQYQDGCGCSFWPIGKEPKFDDPKTHKYVLIGNYNKQAWINIDGKTIELRLIKDTIKYKGKKGDKYYQTYQSGNIVVNVECVATGFGDTHSVDCNAAITINKGDQKQVTRATGSCGC